jgi:hypothetical protein
MKADLRKTDLRRRIDRLEAKLGKSDANKVDVDTKGLRLKLALMAIVAFHVGKLSGGEALATASARALDMTTDDLKNAFRPGNHDGPEPWPLFLEKLNIMVAARGGRPITENGSRILERPRQDDDRRDGFEVLDELYREIPDEIKKSCNLLPFLADYIEKAISASQDDRTGR